MLTQASTTPQATPAPAPTPATVPTPVTAVQVQVPGATRPITQQEISVLRQQRSDMSEQLSSARSRREELIDEIRSAPNGTEQGLLEHLKVVDGRIIAIERDLEATGQTIRSGQVPVGITIVPPRGSLQGADNIERGAAIGAILSIPLLVIFLASRWRRRGIRRDQAASNPMHEERMERLEQAVDAIAIEVERVGESQRYQAKLLAEANIIPSLNMGQRAAEPIPAKEYEGRR